MRLISFTENGGSAAGILRDEGVFPLADLGFASALEFIAGGERAVVAAEKAAPKLSSQELRPFSKIKLLAPIPRPPKILCVGLNYRDHAIESKMEIPPVPTVFAKYPTAVIGPGSPIVISPVTEKPDYEAELAVVIGKGGERISRANWRNHVFGYTVLNDVSAATYNSRPPSGPWARASAPLRHWAHTSSPAMRSQILRPLIFVFP